MNIRKRLSPETVRVYLELGRGEYLSPLIK